MSVFSVESSLYEVNGVFIQTKRESGILLKKEYSSVVYCPKPDERHPGAMYPRCIELQHGEKKGTLLATFECYTYEEPVFPIYESEDEGRSWKKVGEVRDLEKQFGCRFQPQLFELPIACGELEAGTILCAGNIIPEDFSTCSLHLYKSSDIGRSWSFVSEIISGGEAKVDPEQQDENRPVWEPFLAMTPAGKLICYYSDERYAESKKYNQLLAHKVSEDGGATWGEEKIDVAFPDGILRPGMPIVTALSDGRYMMVYEIVNRNGVPVYFRISDSMEDWGDLDFIGNPVTAVNGHFLTGTPYVTWIPYGGQKGTVLASGRGFSHIMANSNAGEGFWEPMEALVEIDNTNGAAGYSQCLVPIQGGKKVLNICPRQMSADCCYLEAAVAAVYERVE